MSEKILRLQRKLLAISSTSLDEVIVKALRDASFELGILYEENAQLRGVIEKLRTEL